MNVEETREMHYGRNCPKGMVQVEFVGVNPDLRMNAYGWMPSNRAFIELWVDGRRYRIDAGDIVDQNGETRRGISVVSDNLLDVEVSAVNSARMFVKE